MDEKIAALKAELPCREEQIDLLAGLIGEPGWSLPSCIYVYGYSGCGKSSVVEGVLKAKEVIFCTANCVEIYTQQLLYQTVVNKFTGWSPSACNNYAPYAVCDTLGEFLLQLQTIAQDQCKGKRMALVLYQCERLRDGDPHLLPALCRLQELCSTATAVNITVLLVSALPADKILPTSGAAAPLVLHFPQYGKEELLQLLLRDRLAATGGLQFTENFHHTYINLVLSVFYPATRSITEMSHLLSVHWTTYSSPVARGEIAANDVAKLWRNIEPHLRKALETVYLREVTSAQYEEMQKLAEQSNNTLPSLQTISSKAAKVELPFYSKYLLIAAYLASYNPAKSDKRFFMKHHGKQKKTAATIKAKERSCSQLTGPKQFPLDRLLAIFYAISEYKVAPPATIFTQLRSLVSLRLLVQIGGVDQLDTPKYKCIVPLTFIRTIARTLDFDIVNHLYDFA